MRNQPEPGRARIDPLPGSPKGG